MEEEVKCKRCQDINVEEGYHTDLCVKCRDELVNTPIPMWVKLACAIIVCITVFALTKFPEALNTAIAFERGIRAEADKNYITAQKQYESVRQQYEDSKLVMVRLINVYYYNGEFSKLDELFSKLEGQELSDEQIEELNSVYDKMNYMYVSDELNAILAAYGNEEYTETEKKLQVYCENNAEDVYGLLSYASIEFDLGKYDEALNIYQSALDKNAELTPAYLNIAAVYRETQQFDKAIEECNKVLAYNAESVSAYIALSKIERERGQNTDYLDLALKAYSLSSEDYVAANLATAYHYNNMIEKRDELFKTLEQNDYYDIENLRALFGGQGSSQ